MPDGIDLPGGGAFEHSQRVVEGGKLLELVLPHAQDGQRRDDQQALDAPGVPKRAGDGDGGQGLAGSHLHQECGASAGIQAVKRKMCGVALMPIGGSSNRQFHLWGNHSWPSVSEGHT